MTSTNRRWGWRFGRKAIAVAQRAGWDPITGRLLRRKHNWVRVGSPGCGWYVPPLPAGATCYCVGTGEDITFDLGLVSRFDAMVYAFDPTPRARVHAEQHSAGNQNFTLYPWAIWKANETVRLYEPANSAHVSHSIVNLQATDRYFEAPGRSIDSVMRELGHDSIAVLKLDIEGAEYLVIEALLSAKVRIDVLNVEFDELSINRRGFRKRIRSTARALEAAGYELVLIDNVSNYHFALRSH